MKKIVAVLTQKGSLSRGLQENTTVNLFQLEDDKVTGVENIPLKETSVKEFSLLMAIKEVSLIYVETINNELIRLLELIGIKTKCKDEISNDQFINKFIFD